MLKLGVVLLSVAALSGCLANNMEMTQQMATTPSVPKTQAQAEKLAPSDPNLVSVYYFVPDLFRAGAFAVAINGRAARVRVELDGKTVARIPVKKGIRLDLLPNETYTMRLGEDWDENREMFMKRHIYINTPDIGEFKAFDLSDDESIGGDTTLIDVKRLTLDETLDRIDNFELIETEQPMPVITALSNSFTEGRKACLNQQALQPCADLVAGVPDEAVSDELRAHIAKIETRIAAEEAEKQRKQQLVAMEQALPPSVRRDKYMMQLSQYLKQKDYQNALEIFPKLEALPVKPDPSLKFFYGDTLLRTGQTEAAQKKLYEYISEQGTDATNYTRALELLNAAETGVAPPPSASERQATKSAQTAKTSSQPSGQSGSRAASASGSTGTTRASSGNFFACYDPGNFICIEYNINSASRFQQMRQQCQQGGNRVIESCDHNAPSCSMTSSVGSQTTYVHNMTEPSAVEQACVANGGRFRNGG